MDQNAEAAGVDSQEKKPIQCNLDAKWVRIIVRVVIVFALILMVVNAVLMVMEFGKVTDPIFYIQTFYQIIFIFLIGISELSSLVLFFRKITKYFSFL